VPKQKTHKGLAKRITITGAGRVKHRRSFAGHLMSGKSGKRRRLLRRPVLISGTMARKTKTLLGA